MKFRTSGVRPIIMTQGKFQEARVKVLAEVGGRRRKEIGG